MPAKSVAVGGFAFQWMLLVSRLKNLKQRRRDIFSVTDGISLDRWQGPSSGPCATFRERLRWMSLDSSGLRWMSLERPLLIVSRAG
ncbi:hypothetical protein NDU88_000863 [Pleurodeles waltl]|uniref:Secreted protein n=1 Tax=Pleurodeles waltl TaxID=8319 RepID=A0AAV7VUR4_PLEWA|nr:hypothetical protein NDU88_000863 [Pleurodeles waltl]